METRNENQRERRERPLGEVAKDLTQDVSLLVRQEIELAKAEMQQKVTRIGKGVAAFGVAALMLSDGMKDEAFHTAWGVYHVTYETKGYWFRTPEAYDVTGNYRASMYMRPAAIWALEMTRPPAAVIVSRICSLPALALDTASCTYSGRTTCTIESVAIARANVLSR